MSILDIKKIRLWYSIAFFACAIYALIAQLVIFKEASGLLNVSIVFVFAGEVVAEAICRKIRKTKRRVKEFIHPIELYTAGIITLTFGFICEGTLKVSGKSHKLVIIYWILGIFALIMGLMRLIKNLNN